MVEDVAHHVLRFANFLADAHGREFAELGVSEGVVGDVVALGEDAAGEIGRGGDALADHEKRGVQAAALELVEDAIGDAGGGAVIEGERDVVFRGRAGVDEFGRRGLGGLCGGGWGGRRRADGVAGDGGDFVEEFLRGGGAGAEDHSGERIAELFEEGAAGDGHGGA